MTSLILNPAISAFARATGKVASNDAAVPGDRLCGPCRKTPRLETRSHLLTVIAVVASRESARWL